MDAHFVIVHIPADKAEIAWPDIEHHIRKATDESDGRYLPEDVLAEVKAGEAHLWIVWNEATQEADAAMTTKIMEYPRKRVAFLHFCGGENMPQWIEEWVEVASRYARDCGASSLELTGRRGWAKIVPDVRIIGTTLVKDL